MTDKEENKNEESEKKAEKSEKDSKEIAPWIKNLGAVIAIVATISGIALAWVSISKELKELSIQQAKETTKQEAERTEQKRQELKNKEQEERNIRAQGGQKEIEKSIITEANKQRQIDADNKIKADEAITTQEKYKLDAVIIHSKDLANQHYKDSVYSVQKLRTELLSKIVNLENSENDNDAINTINFIGANKEILLYDVEIIEIFLYKRLRKAKNIYEIKLINNALLSMATYDPFNYVTENKYHTSILCKTISFLIIENLKSISQTYEGIDRIDLNTFNFVYLYNIGQISTRKDQLVLGLSYLIRKGIVHVNDYQGSIEYFIKKIQQLFHLTKIKYLI